MNVLQLFSLLHFSLLTQLLSTMWQRSVCASTTSPPPQDTSNTIDLIWSANISSLYPPSDPLVVSLGDRLNFTCPQEPDTSSNIWIQNYLEQYENCSCFAVSEGTNVNCAAESPTMHVCQEKVMITITFDSKNLDSALSFQPNTTYYLISYSRGGDRLAGFKGFTSGGECLQGFRMAFYVQPTDSTDTLAPPTTVTASTTDPEKTSTIPKSVEKTTKSSKISLTPRIDLGSVGNLNGASSLVINKTVLLSIFIAFCFVNLMFLF